MSYFGNSTLMVEKKFHSSLDCYSEDMVKFGINPETLQIVTPIYSEYQERFIEVYTKEQAEQEYRKKLSSLSYNTREFLALNKGNLELYTIWLEIHYYLDKLPYYLPKSPSIYLNENSEEVNEEFIKHFVKKVSL